MISKQNMKTTFTLIKRLCTACRTTSGSTTMSDFTKCKRRLALFRETKVIEQLGDRAEINLLKYWIATST